MEMPPITRPRLRRWLKGQPEDTRFWPIEPCGCPLSAWLSELLTVPVKIALQGTDDYRRSTALVPDAVIALPDWTVPFQDWMITLAHLHDDQSLGLGEVLQTLNSTVEASWEYHNRPRADLAESDAAESDVPLPEWMAEVIDTWEDPFDG